MERIRVVPVGSPLHGTDVLGELLAELRPALDAVGAEVVTTAADVPRGRPLAVVVLTGGTERAILDVISSRRGEPALLFAHGGHNSLPAALEALARLQQDGGMGRVVQLDRAAREVAAQAIADVAAWHAMHRSRIGLVGEPSDWLVASAPTDASVWQRWGPTVIHLSIEAALAGYSATGDVPVTIAVGARHIHEPTAVDLAAASRLEPVLRTLVERHRLDAVAVRCFDLLGEAHTSGCVALSALNDAGTVAGCEGDLATTLGLLWVRQLLGATGWMANPAVIDPSQGVIELAHCTVPRRMVDSYDLRSHFESGLGVGIAGELRAGPVTVLRVGGRELDRLWCQDGEAMITLRREDRCRTQLDVRVDAEAAQALLDHPLGNHLIMVEGHHATRLRRWHDQMITRRDAA